ncbi:MAG: PHP domain-containing protein, partial [Synergistaceae bacterium]|nr:PHP domain-containing protein [Synergistaceae bacterium]
MKIVADLHTHTIVSGHAYGTIREMAASAAERKLSMLGITEHAPGVPGTADPLYYGNISAVPRELYGVKMLFGSEINVLNDGTLSLSQEYIDMLDYAIAGIHTICYENEEVEGNTDNLISCMKNDKVCFVSHPD